MKGRCEGVSIIYLAISVILHACDCVCIIVNVLTMKLVVGTIKQGRCTIIKGMRKYIHMFMNKELT